MSASDAVARPVPVRPAHPHADRSADSGVAVHPLIAERWSPRNIDPVAPVEPAALLTVVEAARVAASWGSTFPVRFVAGLRGDPTHTAVAEALDPGNDWATAAGALVLVVVQTANDGGELPYAMFDAGLATAQLTLQAVAEGMIAHPMAGFDHARVRRAFAVPDRFEPLVVIALGHLNPDEHPDAAITERDRRPRPRPSLSQTVFAGSWGTPFPGSGD